MAQRPITPTPRLSIILPVYNVDPYLNQCLDSIQGQTYRDWEAILVDDGSRDFSGIICDGYAKGDPRFWVIHQENQGVSAARNAGLDVARGELLAFVDPDDFIAPGYFELLITELDRTGADVTTAYYCVVQEDGTQPRLLKKGDEYLMRLASNMSEAERTLGPDDALAKTVDAVPWGKVFRSAVWGTTRFPAMDLSEDIAVVPVVLVRARNVVDVPEATYYYRVRRNSLCRSPIPWGRFVRSLAANELMYQRLVEYDKSKKKEFECLRFWCDKDAVAGYKKSNGDKRSFMLILYRGRHEACELVDSGVLDV